jgi:lipoprotein NlpI
MNPGGSPFLPSLARPLLAAMALCCLAMPARPAATNTPALIEEAQRVLATNSAAALALCHRAVAQSPDDPRTLFTRARIRDLRREFAEALSDATVATRLAPARAEVWQLRGEVNFKLGRFRESVADFDRFLEIVPGQRPHHWQRGLSLYYAGDFETGRKQFEIHQTVNANDVENAAWHFLCVAAKDGADKARAALIKSGPDSRVPMKVIHALFAGTAKPADVLAAAAAGTTATAAQKMERLFYAHLYIGLHAEALKETALAREHIFKAEAIAPPHYMGDVARVHAKKLRDAR